MSGASTPGAPAPLDYLVVGHITRDLLAGAQQAIGGTAAYSALTAAALGQVVGVITSIGPDIDITRLTSSLAVEVTASPATTTFENLYIEKRREQRVYTVATTLTSAQIPARWCAVPVVHIGPIMDECAPSLATAFAEHTFLGVTPQGWLRMRGQRNQVQAKPWEHAELWLRKASAVVLSLDDLGGDWSLARHFAQRTPLLVITFGWQGGTLFVKGQPTTFSAYPVTEVDPTGAGDIFAAALFVALAQQTPPLAACRYAARLAAYSVTRRGLDSIPTPEEIAATSLAAF